MSTDNSSQEARVYVVDDHPIVCRGLVELINREPDMAVCGHAESGEVALQQIKALKPDLAVVDLSLKGMGGLDLIRNATNYLPEMPILVVSMYDENHYAQRALHAGARGYIMKGAATEQLLEALRGVLAGEIYVSETVKKLIIQNLARGQGAFVHPIDSLSDRELEVFTCIGHGLTTQKIAQKLHLSVKTIEAHRANIREKLHLSNHVELVKAACTYIYEQERGQGDTPPPDAPGAGR